MKKTKSPTRSASKPGGKSGETSKTSKPSQARKPGRIPVRGALKSSKPAKSAKATKASKSAKSGVSDRAAAAQPSRGNLAEVRALAIAAIDAALDKKALAPILIDVSAMSSYTDFIGIVSGRSDRQVDAIAENVRQVMKARGRVTLGQEGRGNGRWTLLDFGSVVIHVFYHPVREFYDLESLWIEAPRIPLEIPADAQISEPDAYYAV
ncbi:MAG TPA: ribosome silencing factor [Polyangia bacterium]|nr:ribosome silencing factor [Polyangia bacterium]